MTKYTDTRQFEAWQLPDGPVPWNSLPAWLTKAPNYSRIHWDDGQWVLTKLHHEAFTLLLDDDHQLRPGDYILRYEDGTICPMAREEFEKHCRVAGEEKPITSEGLKTSYCPQMEAKGMLSLEGVVNGPMRFFKTHRAVTDLVVFKRWLESQLREQYTLMAGRELREPEAFDRDPVEDKAMEDFGQGRMASFEECYLNFVKAMETEPADDDRSKQLEDFIKEALPFIGWSSCPDGMVERGYKLTGQDDFDSLPPDEPAGDGWQDIATAPENEHVLLFCPDRGITNEARIELGCAAHGWRKGNVSNMSYHSWLKRSAAIMALQPTLVRAYSSS